MSIKDQLTEDMKQAMKDREAGKLRLSVIRMVRANIKNVEINEKKELNDDEVLAILLKEVKMSRLKQKLRFSKNICLNRLAMKNCVLWLLKLSPRLVPKDRKRLVK